MAYDENLANRVRRALARRKALTEKKMFVGIGFLLNGNMCVGVWREFLILRVGESKAEALLSQKHARPFDITGRAMSGWVMIAPEGWRSRAALAKHLQTAKAFVRKLPGK